MTSAALTIATSTPTQREFWTPEELAEELHTTPQALANIRVRGDGPPFVKVGGKIRYPVVAVRLWSLQRATTTTAPAI